MTETTLFIHGPLKELDDVLRIARSEGKRYLRTERVIVKPYVKPFREGYLVVVEPDGSRCSGASDGGRDKNKK